MSCVLSLAPPNLVDLFLNLQTLEVIEFRFVRLKLCVELVLAALFRLVAFEKDDATALVACSQVVSSVVEFDSGYVIENNAIQTPASQLAGLRRVLKLRLTDDVCFCNVFDFTLVCTTMQV